MKAEEILGIAKISTKAQVTIPVDARKTFELEIGDKLLFVKKAGELLIRKSK
jgi:AbrB family looped-hinge helix DNA binding protein